MSGDRERWAAGDYDAIGALFRSVGGVVAAAVPIEPGMRVLDVGTGTGSVAVAAAARGAEVVGLDIVPEHFAVARQRAAEAGVEVAWVEGDACALPYDDESFDRVLSAFGSIVASDPDGAALELVRVCRHGGEVVLATWTRDGFGGRLSDTIRGYREPTGETAPSQWGDEGHVRRTLGGHLLLAFEPGSVDVRFASAEAMLEHYEANLGPLVLARAELEPARYEALRGDVRALIEELDVGDGATVVPLGYLVVIGHKPVVDTRPNY